MIVRLAAAAAVLAALVTTAVFPDVSVSAAGAASGCVKDPNIGFCVVPTSYKIEFGRDSIGGYQWHAYSFVDLGTTTITVADGTTRSVNHYRFQRLVVDQNALIQQTRPDYQMRITAPGPIELGGSNNSGASMWTDVWGSGLQFRWGLCLFTWSWVPDDLSLNISGCWLRMDAYALTSYNPQPQPGQRDNPVNLPNATLSLLGGT
ncbi:hypothetical protein [Alloactinosynnema sp. L-07]|uniref:hypothetical protein n=1 Tax=Alloactinosynnema sp. L-07 TaxID=1653480 RepID=UPI00065EFEA9|nr:hypothetical protein [Alloactinosynnema sp. L-07]CRK58708.1 hypothetical protein [Alloactinosynnema sp. L-07]